MNRSFETPQGRYTTREVAEGYDGGARHPAPTKQPPEVQHDRDLIRAMRSGESDVGARLSV
jgi:hypothetical protein